MKVTDESKHVDTRDMEPDLDEVQQAEAPLTAVPVEISGPVETRELPTKRIAPRTVAVGTVAASKLLGADPRRKFATIIGRTQDILIGANQAQAKLSGAWMPGVVPYVTYTQSELWGIGDGADTDVTVIEEYWA